MPKSGLSNKRERGTGVAIVRRRHTQAGLKRELREITSHLSGNTPLNKTERERLNKRRKRIIHILCGKNPWHSIVGKRRGGFLRNDERVPYAVKKASLDILDLL